MKFNRKYGGTLSCFYCSADSDELKLFLMLVIGMIALASILTFIGLYMGGKFKNIEKVKHDILKIENLNE